MTTLGHSVQAVCFVPSPTPGRVPKGKGYRLVNPSEGDLTSGPAQPCPQVVLGEVQKKIWYLHGNLKKENEAQTCLGRPQSSRTTWSHSEDLGVVNS